MYFSVITPEPGQEREAARAALSRPYTEHQWLWRFFPAEPGTARDFLFRRDDPMSGARYHVVSQRPPQPIGSAWRIQTKPYAPNLQVGDPLEFQLRANPVVTRKTGDKHRRHDVVMDVKRSLLRDRRLERWAEWESEDRPATQDLVRQACATWLVEQGKRRGFEVEADGLSVEGYQRHCEQKRGGPQDLQFSTVDFQGQLTVTEPTLFVQTLRLGIGHAKAFGCGLLLVRRPL